MPKKLLITISTAAVARNILRSGVLGHFRGADIEIFVVVPESKYKDYAEEFGGGRVKILMAPATTHSCADRALSFLARNGFGTGTIRMWQKMEFHWNHKRAMYVVKRFLRLAFGKSRAFHGLIRVLQRSLPADSEHIKFLRRVNPDLIFITDVFADADIALWHAAGKIGKKVVAMVRSWDNLTGHGLIRLLPGTLIVHNPFLERLATSLQHIPQPNVVITGLPHYDWYARKALFKSRENFLRGAGLDPSKKFILFAGIGNYLAPHESEVVKLLDEAIEKGRIDVPAAVLFRPHPAFLSEGERIAFLPHTVFDDNVRRHSASGSDRGEMGEKEMAHLVNSLLHADVVVTTASSMVIDAAAFDRPIVCIAFDGESSEPYWNSVRRYYKDFTHFKMITETGGFRVVFDGNGLVREINEYLKNPSRDQEGRKRIFDDYIWRLDGRSGKRLADAILGRLGIGP
jgi:hypothetical protein